MFGEFGEEAPADQAAPADDGGLFGGADDAAAPADDAGMFGEFGEEAPADEAAPADDGGLFGGADDAAAPADDAGMFGEFGEEAPAEEAAPADDAAPAEDSGLFEGFDEQPADDGSLFDAIPEDAPGDEAAPATEPEDESSLFGAAEILGLPGGLASDEFRTWTDNTGLHKCQGRLLSAVDGHAKLLKANGRTSTVPFNRLSNDDISFVNRQVDASQHTLLQQTAQR
jgi:hypothetical protein